MSLPEMIEEFEIKDLHKSGAIFDVEKLRWFNRQYLLKEPESSFVQEAVNIMKTELTARNIPWDEERAARIMPLIRERISVWEDLRNFIREGEFDFFFTSPSPDPSTIPGKGSDAETAKKHLAYIRGILSALPPSEWKEYETVKDALWDYATKEGKGPVLWPLRYSLTGRERSPDPFLVCIAIGKTATVERIDAALDILKMT